MPHPGHGQHLCYLNNVGFHITNPTEYRSIVRNAAYICKLCGRVAAKKSNLCKPVKL